MVEAQNTTVDATNRNVNYTIPLTEAAESGEISPDEYVRRRASIVGEGTIIESIVMPLVLAVWRTLFPVHARNGRAVKTRRKRAVGS